MKKFLAVLFLQNADYSTYNELLVEYRKSYANKLDIYPKSLEDVVDVMQQVVPKKKKPTNNRNGNGNGKNDQDGKGQEIETSNAQTTKGNGDGKGNACYACGDKTCRLWRCEKKEKIPYKD